eukprot:scaffold7596_cov113-Isochrysis_galbana.AAC.7
MMRRARYAASLPPPGIQYSLPTVHPPVVLPNLYAQLLGGAFLSETRQHVRLAAFPLPTYKQDTDMRPYAG